jgi:hypothetical protein
MDSLRNLTVGITFEDNATRDLMRIEDKTDDIRDNFRGMSAGLAELSVGFGQVGIVGSGAMNDAERAADDLKDEIGELNGQLGMLAVMSKTTFEKMEDDIDDAKDEMEELGRETNRTTAKVVLLGTALTAAFSGAVAASAPLLVGVGALAASFGAAGIGVVAFGAVAVGALTDIFETQEEIAKLQEKIANADSAKERIKAQKELAALYADMSKEQRGALQGLQEFKSFWAGFVKEFEKPIFSAFSEALKGTQSLLTALKPTISGVSGVVVEMMQNFNSSFQNPTMKGFFDWLSTSAPQSLANFGQIMGNTFSGMMNLFQAFSPLSSEVENGLIGMTARFKEWAAGLSQSKAFQNFVEYAKTNGPVLLRTIGNIVDIFKNLVTELAPFGTTVLSGLQSFTSLISNNWPAIKETVIGLGTAVLTFKGIMMGLSVIGTINTLMTAWRTGTMAATLAQMGLNAAMWASPLTWVVAGIAAVVAAGVLLYRNWDTVKAKAVELWNKIKTHWELLKQSSIIVWGMVKDKISSAMETAKSKVSAFFSPLLNFISNAKAAWDRFVSALKNFKMPKIGLPKWMGGKGLIQLPGHATGLSSVPHDDYVARLHKDETVLRADQSRALEQAGILDRSGYTPRINSLGSASSTAPKAAGGSVVFSPKVDIHVTTADVKSAGSLDAAVNKKLDEMWQMFLDIYPVEVVR